MAEYQQKVLEILTSNRANEVFYTHTSLIQPRGKFCLSNSQLLEEFWYNFCRAIDEDAKFGITEVPGKFVPVVVDIDLKFRDVSPKKDEHHYSPRFVETLVQVFQSVLKEWIVDADEDTLLVVYLDKAAYTSGTVVKNGFHLHFPNCFLNRSDIEVVIYPRVMIRLEELFQNDKSIFDGFLPIDFMDTGALGNTWLLYGSRKSEDMEPYKVAKVFNAAGGEGNLNRCPVFNTMGERIEVEDPLKVLPRIFSINVNSRRVYRLREEHYSLPEIQALINKKEKKVVQQAPHLITTTEDKLVDDLLSALNMARFENYQEWLTIGWCLHSIYDGATRGLELWIKYARQSPKFIETEHIFEWNRMKHERSYSIATLKFFANKDNPEMYQTILSCQKVRLTEDGTSHAALARILYDHSSQNTVYCNKLWYVFKDHYWTIADEGLEIKKLITFVLIPRFESIRVQLLEKSLEVSRKKSAQIFAREEEGDDDDDDMTKRIKAKLERLDMVLRNLQSAPFKNNVMAECKELFHDQQFENKLDQNPLLLGFKNGIFELSTHVFREGRPTDYLQNHAPVNYREFEGTEECVLNMLHFFKQVFTDDDLRQYFFDIMSDSLVSNVRKHVYIWSGQGDNAKTVTQKLFEYTFGTLSKKGSTTLLTRPRGGSNSHSADLARLGGGVKFVWMDEPDNEEELYDGQLKAMSGSDSMYARDLYQTGRDAKEIRPMFTMSIICNNLPRVRCGASDQAFWNRMRVISFTSKFTAEAPQSVEEQFVRRIFPVDPHITSKFALLAEPLAWYIIQNRLRPRLPDPKCVIEPTELYKRLNNILLGYLALDVVKSDGGEISLGEIFYRYREWYKENMSKNITIDIFRFEDNLSKLWGPPDEHKIWRGQKFKEK